MPKLSLIAAEAKRLIGKLPEPRQRARQQVLTDLCEAHWREMRGPEPETTLAHEPMMLFESAEAGAIYAERVAAALRGQLEAVPLHPHASRPPLWKALAVVAAHTGRCDLKAVIEVIRLLAVAPASGQPSDEALERLRNALGDFGIRFLGIDDHHVRYEQHHQEHKPANLRQVCDMLVEIRQAWLA